MKPDTSTSAFLLCALATLCVHCSAAAAFVTSSAAAPGAVRSPPKSSASLLSTYPLPDGVAYMQEPAAVAAGNVLYQPRNSQEANERSVYDPGDELLRTLNAEMAASGQELGTLPEEPDYADTVFNELEVANKYDMLRKLESDIREEQEIVGKSALLMKLLEDPTIQTLPLVYVEEDTSDLSNNFLYSTATGVSKRSRYYRRYPWKRHNRNRSTYEPELRYACTPTKEDVFKLLVNLHENRKGNHSKTVNFCNRKRPAKAIFTNIRFLG